VKTTGQKMKHAEGIKSKGTAEFLNRVKKARIKKALANKTRKAQRKKKK